ncbi:hypothetical protein V7S43_002962 [Phytophthora oleae]|uniref:Uncharacterized protein n=1 Tax=Phytophthora oleae TaxID=2107226 RepID=A0ABD3G555_9STRA
MECYPLRQSSVFNDYNIVFLPYCTGDLFVDNKYTRGLQPAVPEPRHVHEQMQQRDGNMEVGIRELLDPEQIVKAAVRWPLRCGLHTHGRLVDFPDAMAAECEAEECTATIIEMITS